MNGFENVQNFGKDQMDRTLASVNAMTNGIQAIASEIADFQKKSFEDGSAAVEKLLSVRSVERAVEVQTDLTRQAYETFLGRATKMGELYAGLARDAYKPFEGVIPGSRAAA